VKFPKVFNPGWSGLLGALLALGLAVTLLDDAGKSLKALSYDLPHFIRGVTKPEEVVLVYIDDESHENLKQPRNRPWDRSLYAVLLDRLAKEKARGVVFDVIFDSSSDPFVDERLARAMTNAGLVVLGVDFVPMAVGREGVEAKGYIPPIDLFRDAADALGDVHVPVEGDLVIRQFTYDKEELIPPMSVAAAEVFSNSTNHSFLRWVYYYGPPGTLPHVSFFRAISETEIPPGFFHGKIVLIGSRMSVKAAGERNDDYLSPYSRIEKGKKLLMPGAEIQATLLLNLLRNEWLEKMPLPFERSLTYFLAVGLGLFLPKLRPLLACGFCFFLMMTVTGFGFFSMLYWKVWFNWSVPVVVLFFVLIWSIVLSSVSLYVEKRLLQQSLSMYLSPGRVKQIEKNRGILKPGAIKQEVSIFFSDIANFTAFSEGMDSDELAHMMNRYFEAAVGGCIFSTDGAVVKFIGDAIFAIWNAPDPQSNHQERACRSALLFRTQDLGLPPSKPGLEVRTRIGLHCGLANVGDFGSSKRFDWTAIGENINLASRMEGLNKYLGTDILITGEIQKAVEGKFVTRSLGLFRLKGFERVVSVYELMGLPEEAALSDDLRNRFALGLLHFKERKWDEAGSIFQELRQGEKKDGPSLFYLNVIKDLRNSEPDKNWAGEIELKEK